MLMEIAVIVNDGDAFTDDVFESDGAGGTDESDVADADEGLIDGAVDPMESIIGIEIPNGVIALGELNIFPTVGSKNRIIARAAVDGDDGGEIGI